MVTNDPVSGLASGDLRKLHVDHRKLVNLGHDSALWGSALLPLQISGQERGSLGEVGS